MIHKVNVSGDPDHLKADLERYREQALALGASSAAIVKVADIPVEDRVVLKCLVPRCFNYGRTANCPPHALKPAELRDHLKSYNWAVLFSIDVPAEDIVKEADVAKTRAAYREIFHIVTKIESMAFYDGHYLAFGLAAGSCKSLCSQKECPVLAGNACHFPLHARPSMESVGIDVFKMVARAGWDIYPIGVKAKACEVPKGVLAGIIVVE